MPLDEQILRLVRSDGVEPEPARRREWPRRTWGWNVFSFLLGVVLGAAWIGLGV